MVVLGVVCLGVTLALQPLLIWVLSRARMIDVPNHRSSHSLPTPRGGGVGALVAVLAAVVVWHPGPAWIVLAAAVALGLLGLLDDYRPLSFRVRLAAQTAIASAASAAMWGWGSAVTVVLPIAVIFIVGFVNAFNFMDGVNGISGLNAFLMGATFAGIGYMFDQQVVAGLGLITVGCALGLIPFNIAGKIFMGDVGSYLFGGLIALTFVLGQFYGLPLLLMASPLVIYVLDTSTTLLARAWRGERVMEAHRSHIYQRVACGPLGHLGSSSLVAVCGAMLVGSAWISDKSSLGLALAAALSVVTLYLASPRLLSRAQEQVLDLSVVTPGTRQSAGGSLRE